MKKILVDTNIFLRLLLEDIPEQTNEIRLFFHKNALKNYFFTTSIVIFEVQWILSKIYKKDKSECIKLLYNILDLNFIEIENRDYFHAAIGFYKSTSLSFPDCYNLIVASIDDYDEFFTFDKDLKKMFSKIKA